MFRSLDDMIRLLEKNRVLILGFGREGKSSYRLIRNFLPDKQIGIADKNPVAALRQRLPAGDERL